MTPGLVNDVNVEAFLASLGQAGMSKKMTVTHCCRQSKLQVVQEVVTWRILKFHRLGTTGQTLNVTAFANKSQWDLYRKNSLIL